MEENKELLQCWIGIDQSLHSTGVTIQFSDKPNIMFLQFTDTKVKHSNSVICCIYNRVWSNTDDFSTNEINLVKSAHNLFAAMYQYFSLYCKKYDTWNVSIEGQVMSGFSRHQQFHLTDLVKLVSILQYNLLKLKQVKLRIFPPTSVKKYFTGKGKAKKEDMIAEFKLRMPIFDYTGKIDDVVDSYALCEMIAHPERRKVLPKKTKKKKS